MKYFYIRKIGCIFGNTDKNLNITTNEEQLVSSINKGDIDNFYKVKAFEIGDTIQMASEFMGVENNGKHKPYKNAFVKVVGFETVSGHLKILLDGEVLPDKFLNFYIHDVKKEEE